MHLRTRFFPREVTAWFLVAVQLTLPGSLDPAAGSLALDLDSRIEELDLIPAGLVLGIEVAVEGEGVIYSRSPDVARAAASSIKTAILYDLLCVHGDLLDQIPVGLESLLRPGTHPAFAGFTSEQLARCRESLAGLSYRELGRIMMGRVSSGHEVYNAACNMIMVKLGGPEAITRRLHERDPSLRGIDINRYMESWNGDGDNRATPAALVALYSMASSGQVPGLDGGGVRIFRELILDRGDGGPGSVFEKAGTLYPSPMVRVRAGYVEREGADLAYAVMGEISDHHTESPGELFVQLMTTVDSVAVLCRGLDLSNRE